MHCGQCTNDLLDSGHYFSRTSHHKSHFQLYSRTLCFLYTHKKHDKYYMTKQICLDFPETGMASFMSLQLKDRVWLRYNVLSAYKRELSIWINITSSAVPSQGVKSWNSQAWWRKHELLCNKQIQCNQNTVGLLCWFQTSLPLAALMVICTTLQIPLAAHGWPSSNQRLTNKWITLPLFLQWQIGTQGNYATMGSAIVAIAIVGRGGVDEQAFRPQWQFKFQAHFDKWFGLPQCLKMYHLSLYNIKKGMLLTGLFTMLSMPSFDFHLPPCTEGFLIHLSPLWQLPLWQLPLFPSVAQFPCIWYYYLLGEVKVWYGKFSCAKCHTGAKLQAESWYDTKCTRVYRIIPTLNLITNLSYL